MLALFAVPASEGALAFFNTVVSLFLKPTRLVGYDYKHGVPRRGAHAGRGALADRLARRCRGKHPQHRGASPRQHGGRDPFRAAVGLAGQQDRDRRRRHRDPRNMPATRSPGSTPAIRPKARRASISCTAAASTTPAQGCWMGWERKRGKLHELNLLLRGDSDTTFLPPDVPLPENVVHVMTLDADTRTDARCGRHRWSASSAIRSTGRISMPAKRRVTAGYTILQPRVTASLTTGDEASFFQRIFSANRGLDPYVFAVSDVYQDVFGEGTFTGKGLYHVDAFEAALKGRIEENAVLSHDLLEGALARCGAGHRCRTGRGLSDPLFGRRLAPASLGARRLAAAALHLRSALRRAGAVALEDGRQSAPLADADLLGDGGDRRLDAAALHAGRAMAGAADPQPVHGADLRHRQRASCRRAATQTPRGHFIALARDAAFGTALVALQHRADGAQRLDDGRRHRAHALPPVRQPAEPARMAHRLAGAQGRRQRSRLLLRHDVRRRDHRRRRPGHPGAGRFHRRLRRLLLRPVLGRLAGLRLAGSAARPRPRTGCACRPPTCHALRTVARRTWHYFETFVTAEHNNLPPDNFQESPAPVVAPRTSPTNIGVYLLSVVSARDFGWISLSDAIDAHRRDDVDDREHAALSRPSLQLVRHDDAEAALSALCFEPSTAAISPAIWSPWRRPAPNGRRRRPCICRAISTASSTPSTILDESLDELPDDRRQLRPLRQRLRDRIDGMRRAVETIKAQPEMASIRTINLAVLARRDPQARRRHPHRGERRRASEVIADWAARLEATCEAHVARRAQRRRAPSRRCAPSVWSSARARAPISPSRWISPS